MRWKIWGWRGRTKGRTKKTLDILLFVTSIVLVFCLGVAYHPLFWGLGALVYWSIAAYLIIRDKRKRRYLTHIVSPNNQDNNENKDNERSDILPRDNRKFGNPHLFGKQTGDKEQKDKYTANDNQTSSHTTPPRGES